MNTFQTWDEVLAHCTAKIGLFVDYQAPMDPRAHAVLVVSVKGRVVKLDPCNPRECDPFTADEGHLSRFRRA